VERFERSEAVEQLERLERLERTDPVVNGAKRWNPSIELRAGVWNDWNWLLLLSYHLLLTAESSFAAAAEREKSKIVAAGRSA
jgi:hypothetical protein